MELYMNPSVPSSEVTLDLEDGADRLYRNVGNKLEFCAARSPRKARVSCTPRRNPEIMQNLQRLEEESEA
jgi:hypothetical protein